MKFTVKTYLLMAIIIVTALVNLGLLFLLQDEANTESNSLIQTNDLKVKISDVSGYASSISAGNEIDRKNLNDEINNVELIFNTLRSGGYIDSMKITQLPNSLNNEFDTSYNLWLQYKQHANTIKSESVFDLEVRSSINYVLEKNSELILLTNALVEDLSNLDRNYRVHQAIAQELHNLVQEISSNILLISINDDSEAKESLKQNTLLFEVGIRKLLQDPLDDLNLTGLNVNDESLESLPVENSFALKELDPLWESINLRTQIIEQRSLFSPKFGLALNNLNDEKISLSNSLENLSLKWSDSIQNKINQRQNIIQIMSGADIVIFILVLFSIRKSMTPLSILSSGLLKMKEGRYGETINYKSKDEIGDVISTFNIMSKTIKAKTEEAERIDKTKDEFLTMITHELKTPLVPIRGYSDMLLEGHLGELSEKQKDRLKIIKSSSTSLLQLISDLLDAQKLELGQLRMKFQESSMEKTILEVIQQLMPIARDANIELSFSASNDVSLNHDPERIKQVLTNLIKNSFDAIKKNGKVEIFMIDSNDEIKITVKDNGPGIPDKEKENLFKKFYQLDTSLTREKGGSGLGLTICKGIVNAHHGKIWVENILPNGAQFFVTIPKNIRKVQ